jgi:hypothetical protein
MRVFGNELGFTPLISQINDGLMWSSLVLFLIKKV